MPEFQLRIDKASYDKASGEYRWSAVASDTELDVYDESMSHELFRDFIARIEKGEQPPMEFRSDAWQGGMPYVSVSHYLDLNGIGIAGDVSSIYIDGKYLKAKGTFRDTDLGRACFRAICKDLDKNSVDPRNKVRVSIAFLDYAHSHGDVRFERKNLVDDRCPMCERGIGNKTYLKGVLIHLALTRIPANRRTDITPEVNKSMATKHEDAASIVGTELADELESAQMVGKSEALVERGEDQVETVEGGGEVSNSDAAEVVMESSVTTVENPQVIELLSQILERVSSPPAEPVSHVLDPVFAEFRSQYDAAPGTGRAKLEMLQGAFENMALKIRSIVDVPPAPDSPDAIANVVEETIQRALKPMADRLALLEVQLKAAPVQKSESQAESVPQRRSLPPTILAQNPAPKLDNSIDAVARRSVYGM